MKIQSALLATLPLCLFFLCADASAAPDAYPLSLADKNMKIRFEVYAPWNILEGTGEQISGELKLKDDPEPDSLRADISVQNIDYKAGVRVAGQLVATWLRSNPPTPAKFIIGKSSLPCSADASTSARTCKGSVDGKLTIWGKEYSMDVPVEIAPSKTGHLLTGKKEIKYGEYGFGDPSSSIANLNPTVHLYFSVDLPSKQ